jgi:hypothetical protein
MVAWFQRKPNKTWDVGTPQYYQEKNHSQLEIGIELAS